MGHTHEEQRGLVVKLASWDSGTPHPTEGIKLQQAIHQLALHALSVLIEFGFLHDNDYASSWATSALVETAVRDYLLCSYRTSMALIQHLWLCESLPLMFSSKIANQELRIFYCFPSDQVHLELSRTHHYSHTHRTSSSALHSLSCCSTAFDYLQ